MRGLVIGIVLWYGFFSKWQGFSNTSVDFTALFYVAGKKY